MPDICVLHIWANRSFCSSPPDKLGIWRASVRYPRSSSINVSSCCINELRGGEELCRVFLIYQQDLKLEVL